MGARRAKLYKKRLDDMVAVESFIDLEHLPGCFHQLSENRKDQWSCDLDQPYRLIFRPAKNPIPKNDDSKQVLIEIKSVEIIEITNYHKEG
jgi:proteic killer suppression protein